MCMCPYLHFIFAKKNLIKSDVVITFLFIICVHPITVILSSPTAVHSARQL